VEPPIILAVMACKAAVKAGSPLTTEEMQSLIARADQIEKATSCPHGRPTMLRLTLRDLEKQFHRT
jgi:DNA mismatch repair protein MutL